MFRSAFVLSLMLASSAAAGATGTRIEVTVLSPDGKPVEGAAVSIGEDDERDTRPNAGKTDRRGMAALTWSAPSTVRAWKSGFAAALPVRVDRPKNVSLRLERGWALHVEVVDDGGKLVAGAQLQVRPEDSSVEVRRPQLRHDPSPPGHVELPDGKADLVLEPTDYELYASHRPEHGWNEVTVERGTPSVRIVIPRAASVVGRLVAHGEPALGLEVWVHARGVPDSPGSRCEVRGDRFRCEAVSPGEVHMSFGPPLRQQGPFTKRDPGKVLPVEKTVQVGEGEQKDLGDVSLDAAGRIEGVLAGAPEGTRVSLSGCRAEASKKGAASPHVVLETTTDRTGAFVFEQLAPCEYTVSVYGKEGMAEDAEVKLEEGLVARVRMQFEERRPVRVRVQLANGEAVPAVSVALSGDEDSATGVTGVDGTFKANLRVGSYAGTVEGVYPAQTTLAEAKKDTDALARSEVRVDANTTELVVTVVTPGELLRAGLATLPPDARRDAEADLEKAAKIRADLFAGRAAPPEGVARAALNLERRWLAKLR